MAVGKNKGLKGKKGQKKRVIDPFTKKEWYQLKAPSTFSNRNCAKTVVSKTAGTKIASEGLKGRICEVNLADLNRDEDSGFKKIKLRIDHVQDKDCITSFAGLEYTRDKLCSLVKKWQTLIEANVDVKTTDGYTVRVFAIAFTAKQNEQVKTNCYAQSGQIRRIRQRMVAILEKQIVSGSLTDLVKKLVPGSIEKEIQRSASGVFPLKECHIRKVKVLKRPRFDLTKLMEMHQGGEMGADMVVEESAEAQNTLAAEIE